MPFWQHLSLFTKYYTMQITFKVYVLKRFICIQSFLGRQVHTLNPCRHHHDWSSAGKFSKFVPPDALNVHYLVLSVLRFFVKPFPNYLSLHWKIVFFRDDLLKDSYIQMKICYGYKLVRAAKISELKKSTKQYRRNHSKQCKLFTPFN